MNTSDDFVITRDASTQNVHRVFMRYLSVLVLLMLSACTATGSKVDQKISPVFINENARIEHTSFTFINRARTTYSNDTVSAYAHSRFIRDAYTHDGITEMWGLFDYKTPQISPDGKSYMSLSNKVEYNCEAQQMRVLFSETYTKNMGSGQKINTYAAGEWKPVLLGSINGVMWETACARG